MLHKVYYIIVIAITDINPTKIIAYKYIEKLFIRINHYNYFSVNNINSLFKSKIWLFYWNINKN
jgi:hypothetical protein